MLSHLLKELGAKSKGTVVGDEVYVIRMSQSPVALVEVGFISQNDDLKKLIDEKYQRECAKALYDSIREMIDVTYEE